MIVFGIILIVLGLLLPSLVPTFAFAHLVLVVGVILLVVGLLLALWDRWAAPSAAAATTTKRPELPSCYPARASALRQVAAHRRVAATSATFIEKCERAEQILDPAPKSTAHRKRL